ncbi:hypothetical protein Clacol_007961 [Clathrus columnatus]|uniref:Methyltransferase domain-containing protein n=1 Tax=Clathrus columnatus TaxID=1419009 RepID=A0AAV5AP65_9AGAM|nr:hypothetical protein Clacol_007961 [Clathrus columnatus]
MASSLNDHSIYYRITEDEAKFLKGCTGITDDDELKHHILTVQAEAYALGKTRKNAIMLDIGCCFGNDSRKAISDGFPLSNVLCTDLRKGFFDIGHKLFKTTPKTFPLAFFEGDIFDTEFTYPYPTTTKIPNLSALENIGQLKGQVSVIHASSFFHLFNGEKQQELAHILAQLLLTQRSIILGCQIGAPTDEKALATTGDYFDKIFSPKAWKELWIGKNGPFKPDDVEIHANVRSFTVDEVLGATGTGDGEYYWLEWSVLRK